MPRTEILSDKQTSSLIKVVGLTAFAYAIAFFYQYGYLKHFDISYRFIEISPVTIIISIIAATCVLFYLDHPYSSIKHIISGDKATSTKQYYAMYLTRLSAFSIIVLMLLYGSNANAIFWWVYLLIVIISLCSPMLHLRREGGIKAALKRFEHAHTNKDPKTYFEQYYLFLIFAMVLISISVFAGRYMANSVSSAYVLSRQNEVVTILIQKNDSYMIGKMYDTKKQVLLPGYKIIPLQNELLLNERVPIKKSQIAIQLLNF